MIVTPYHVNSEALSVKFLNPSWKRKGKHLEALIAGPNHHGTVSYSKIYNLRSFCCQSKRIVGYIEAVNIIIGGSLPRQ